MKTILLFKEIYGEGFRNLGNYLIKRYFKAFAWFSFIMFIVVLYAFIFRVSTGFAFDQAETVSLEMKKRRFNFIDLVLAMGYLFVSFMIFLVVKALVQSIPAYRLETFLLGRFFFARTSLFKRRRPIIFMMLVDHVAYVQRG